MHVERGGLLFIGWSKAAELPLMHLRNVSDPMKNLRPLLVTGAVLGSVLLAMACAPEPSTSWSAEKKVPCEIKSTDAKADLRIVADCASSVGVSRCAEGKCEADLSLDYSIKNEKGVDAVRGSGTTHGKCKHVGGESIECLFERTVAAHTLRKRTREAITEYHGQKVVWTNSATLILGVGRIPLSPASSREVASAVEGAIAAMPDTDTAPSKQDCVSTCFNVHPSPCDATCGGVGAPSEKVSCGMSCCRDYCARSNPEASGPGQEPPAGMTRVSDFNGVLVGTRGQEHNYRLKKGQNAVKVQTIGSGRLICAVRIGTEYVARSEGEGHCELAFDAIADVEVFLVIQSMDGASHSYKGTIFYGR